MAPKSDLLQGTLDLLILRTLSGDPMHGWGISQRIQQLSKDVLQVNQGSLYPALHRLEQQGLIESGRQRIVLRDPHRLFSLAEDVAGER